jgi:hypothetical protein
LGVNIARDRSVKAGVARQTGGGALRKGTINVKTITRIVVVMLCYIYLRLCWQNTAHNSKAGEYEAKTRPVAASCNHGKGCSPRRMSPPRWNEHGGKAPGDRETSTKANAD